MLYYDQIFVFSSSVHNYITAMLYSAAVYDQIFVLYSQIMSE